MINKTRFFLFIAPHSLLFGRKSNKKNKKELGGSASSLPGAFLVDI
jgi:hypothetical protein